MKSIIQGHIRIIGQYIVSTGPTRAAKAEQKSLVPSRQAQRTNQERTPFIYTLWVPIHLSFNRQQKPPLSSLSDHNLYKHERRQNLILVGIWSWSHGTPPPPFQGGTADIDDTNALLPPVVNSSPPPGSTPPPPPPRATPYPPAVKVSCVSIKSRSGSLSYHLGYQATRQPGRHRGSSGHVGLRENTRNCRL